MLTKAYWCTPFEMVGLPLQYRDQSTAVRVDESTQRSGSAGSREKREKERLPISCGPLWDATRPTFYVYSSFRHRDLCVPSPVQLYPRGTTHSMICCTHRMFPIECILETPISS